MLMRERQQLLSAFFSIPDSLIKLVRYMMVLRQWIGWSRSKREVLLSHLRPLPAFGEVWMLSLTTIVSILLILQDTLTSLLRLSALFAYSMGQLSFYVALLAFSLKRKQFGVKLISTKSLEWFLLIKWIALVQIL